MPKIIFFDCDSTLSAIEGIDELARLRGAKTLAAVEEMTRKAMDGGVPIEEIFARRLDLIRPTAAELRSIGERYIANIEQDAALVFPAIRAAGWLPVIVSGGFTDAIRPLADCLGVERVEAVGMHFDAAGNYVDFDRTSPTARSHGKNAVIRKIKAQLSPQCTVMVGDGASDLETLPDVDLFVGFGRFVVREKIRAAAPSFITKLSELPDILHKIAVKTAGNDAVLDAN